MEPEGLILLYRDTTAESRVHAQGVKVTDVAVDAR